MKSSYKKILIFQIIIFLILILNSFVISILTNYNMILFLFALLVIFKVAFGFEKDRYRYTKDIIIETCIFMLIFFLLYYLLGIIIGFARVDNYYNLSGIKNFILPVILISILKEIFRHMMLIKSEGNNILILFTCILFILLDTTNAIYYGNFSSSYNIFIFIALSLLPAISKNIVFTYLSTKIGCKPIIVYLLIISLYQYLLPIVPNSNEYVLSLINLLLPIFFGYMIFLFLKKEKDEEINRNYRKNKYFLLIIPILITVISFYLSSGYFKYYAVAIASGSMTPKINKGDVVIIEKINNRYEKLKKGQIIAYRYNDVIVVHRIVNIIKDKDSYYFYTKGDANSNVDDYPIEENMIIGIVNLKIPYVGLPTVWLNDL